MIFFILLLSSVLCGFSQDNRSLHIYRNDGGLNCIFQSSIDSIQYSRSDLNGTFFNCWTNQIIYTKDREYHVPLAAIDSVVFNMPPLEVADYYYSIMPMPSDSEWDSILVTSNGYCAAMATDSNNVVTVAVDAIASDDASQSVIAQLREDLLPMTIMADDRVYSFINYRGNVADILVTEGDEVRVVEGVTLGHQVQDARTRAEGGVSQNHYAEVLSGVNSALTIAKGGAEGVAEATMAGVGMATGNGSTAESDLVLSLSGVSLGAGVALLFPEVSIPAVIVGGIVGGGVSLWKYIEDKLNEDKRRKYEILAGLCEVETLAAERVGSTSYRIGVKVRNSSTIPAAYKNLNTYGLIVKKVRGGNPNIGLNLYQSDVEVVYSQRVSEDGDFHVQLSDLEPGYNYFYRSFVLPYVERLEYEIGRGGSNSSFAYYGAMEVIRMDNAIITGYEQTSSEYKDGVYRFSANVSAELAGRLMAVSGWGISLYRDGVLYKDYPLTLGKTSETLSLEFETGETYLTKNEEHSAVSTKDHWAIGTYVEFSADGYTGRSYSEDKEPLDLSHKKSDLCDDANHVHAVDLGLSVKWACCNVGVDVPEGYGGYYAWGETEEKSDYGWDTYKYYIDTNGDGYKDTWQNIGSNISGTSYDVARMKWGGGWRMPTRDEIKELCEKCSWEWTSVNGVYGQKVTGPNGNSIFLPAAGCRLGTSLRAGSGGDYWSGTLGEDYSYYAYFLFFSGGGHDWYNGDGRNYGFSVRPVSE